MYELTPVRDDLSLCFRMEGDAAERHGSIGCLRADFGSDGCGFWTTWFDYQKHLKKPAFMREFDEVINYLRNDGQEPPFASRRNLEAFCAATSGMKAPERGGGYMVRTQDYSYYFRCKPSQGDYNIYCFSYDNSFLLPELAGQHELPNKCFSTLPSTGERVLIWRGQSGYERFDTGTTSRAALRMEVDMDNARWGVTRAQEEAMLAGSMFGWGVPAAKPWRYEQDGTPRNPPKKDVQER